MEKRVMWEYVRERNRIWGRGKGKRLEDFAPSLFFLFVIDESF